MIKKIKRLLAVIVVSFTAGFFTSNYVHTPKTDTIEHEKIVYKIKYRDYSKTECVKHLKHYDMDEPGLYLKVVNQSRRGVTVDARASLYQREWSRKAVIPVKQNNRFTYGVIIGGVVAGGIIYGIKKLK